MQAPYKLAVVVPCFNERDSLPHALSVLLGILDELVRDKLVTPDSYIFLVDDGSFDGSWEFLEAQNRTNPRVKGLKLSRNFGHQAALFAGLMEVANQCDAAISLDADLQQDPGAIRNFVLALLDGCDVVLGVRAHRGTDGLFKTLSALSFYRLMQALGVQTVPNHADYRLLSRRALRALSLYGEQSIFLRAMCLQLGFKSTVVHFEVSHRRHGETKYSIRKMLRLAIHGITSFSVTPLRFVTAIGFTFFLVSLVMGVYVAWRALYVGDTVPGWASTALPIYFIGAVQLLSLGIVGEYIGHIFTAVKNRPRWIVEDKLD